MKKSFTRLALLLMFLCQIATELNAVEYNTIAAGNWTSSTTWQGGIIPGHTINAGDVVNINHGVIYTRPNDLIVYGKVHIINALFQFPITGNGSGRSITVYTGGFFYVNNSIFIMPIQDGSGNDLSGNFVLDGGRLIVSESSMDIAQNWESKNNAIATLKNGCMRIGQSHLLTSGTLDTSINFNMELGIHGSGNFELSGNSIARLANAKFLITGSGNFKVNGGSSFTGISGYPIALYGLKVTGNLDNDGLWTAVVQDYCLDGPIGGSSAGQVSTHLANPENCTFVNSLIDLVCWVDEAPLSVQLISFQGNLNKNNNASLGWTVTDNEIIKYFDIERSFNGRDFSSAATVAGSTKSGTQKYLFNEAINRNDKVMYRLKIYNKQSNFNYSRVLVLQSKAEINNQINITGNPTTDQLTFRYAVSKAQPISVNIYDMNGKLIMNSKINLLPGDNIVNLKLNSTITKGMYLLELDNGVLRAAAKFIRL